MIVVDAMNVIGSVPDGWWRDRDGALRRLVDATEAHDWPADEWVVVVADGHPPRGLPPGTRGPVELRFANSSAPDTADDVIVALVGEDGDPLTVVTSDAELRRRVEALGAEVEGARTFRTRVGW